MKSSGRLVAPDDVESKLGERILATRHRRKLTIEAVSAKAGITKGFLSKIERGEKTPGVATLVRIAQALDISISHLLEPEDAGARVSVIKVKDRAPFIRSSALGYRYTHLVHGMQRRQMEPFLFMIPTKLRLDPKELRRGQRPSRFLEGIKHPGEEFIMVISGKVKMFIADEEHILERGDTVYFDSQLPHWLVSVDGGQSEILNVLFPGLR